MKVLVYQHARVEHPGFLRHLLAEDGHSWHPVHLDEGETPPSSFDGYDALWVLGGPMDVWDEADHPWLVPEKRLIREAVVGRGLPFLGLCLGHQLLACALGGACGRAAVPEIGVMPVQLTDQGAESIFLDGLDDTIHCLQWHGAEISTLPDGATVLASSPACRVQAMSWGRRALSLQFHVEVEQDTVHSWATLPPYKAALDGVFGETGVDRLAAACAARMATFNQTAERVYINWLQSVAHA